MTEETLIRFVDVSKSYDGKQLFEGLNLEVKSNEVVGLCGESGSGKSTLLRIAVDLVSPDSGSVVVMGKEVSEWDPRELRRSLILIPQEAQMFAGTVRNNLLWGLKLRGETAEESELKEVMEEVNLKENMLDKVAANLSGGERQRVALARGLLLEPEGFLLDEPTSALDQASALAVEDSINELIKLHNIGVLMVTHNEEQAKRFTSRVVNLRGGSCV